MNGTKCETQSLNEEKLTQNETATTKRTSDEQKTPNRDVHCVTQIQMQSAEEKETCAEVTVSEATQQRSQTTDSDKEEEEDQVREVIKEWTNVEEFRLRTFFIILFSASLSFFDFFSDSLLGIKFLQEGFVFDSSKTNGRMIDDNCSALNITTFNYSEYNETREYSEGLYTCNNYNRMFGFATLAISFLPGIQWHTYLKTKYSLGKFLTSLFFPFFIVIFQVIKFSIVFCNAKGIRFWDPYGLKVGHAFHQGPKTAEMNLMLTTCESINESIIQLILQVDIS